MSHMPYWLAKTPEMIAMDKWFSFAAIPPGEDPVDVLTQRYQSAITRVTTEPDRHLADDPAASLGDIHGGAPRAAEAMTHFGTDWLNLDNLNSGGDFWPQIPSWQIIIWLRQGVLTAAKKALGTNGLTSNQVAHLFEAEIDTDPADPRTAVLPMTTIWVCTGNTSSNGFEVDAVRGPTTVELVIATPPPRLLGRLWHEAKQQIDNYWLDLHGNHFPPPPPSDPPMA